MTHETESDDDKWSHRTLDDVTGASFVAYSEGNYYFYRDTKILSVNDTSFDCITMAIPEPYTYVSQCGSKVVLGNRSKLFTIQSDGLIAEKKFSNRILRFYLMENGDLLMLSINRRQKTVVLSFENSNVVLCRFEKRCDLAVLFAEFITESVFVCVYKVGGDVVSDLVAIKNSQLTLIRNQKLATGQRVKFRRLLNGDAIFLLTVDNTWMEFEFVENACALILHATTSAPEKPPRHIEMVDQEWMLWCNINAGVVVVDLVSFLNHQSLNKWDFHLDKSVEEFIHMIKRDSQIMMLLRMEDHSVVLLEFDLSQSFHVEKIKGQYGTETQDIYSSVKSDELAEAIETNNVVLSHACIDHVVNHGTFKDKVACLKVKKLSESDAIRLLLSDPNLFDAFLENIDGDESELVRSLGLLVPINKCSEWMERLIDVYSHGAFCMQTRAVSLMCFLLDSSFQRLCDSEVIQAEWIPRLAELLDSSVEEQTQLQCLASLCCSLLKSQDKLQYDGNALAVSHLVSL